MVFDKPASHYKTLQHYMEVDEASIGLPFTDHARHAVIEIGRAGPFHGVGCIQQSTGPRSADPSAGTLPRCCPEPQADLPNSHDTSRSMHGV